MVLCNSNRNTFRYNIYKQGFLEYLDTNSYYHLSMAIRVNIGSSKTFP